MCGHSTTEIEMREGVVVRGGEKIERIRVRQNGRAVVACVGIAEKLVLEAHDDGEIEICGEGEIGTLHVEAVRRGKIVVRVARVCECTVVGRGKGRITFDGNTVVNGTLRAEGYKDAVIAIGCGVIIEKKGGYKWRTTGNATVLRGGRREKRKRCVLDAGDLDRSCGFSF